MVNRFESKYFNTASVMNEALIMLLEKKDFELITVKEICIKAGVNRSTFYLHYENTKDLLRECIERTSEKFYVNFKGNDIDPLADKLDELIFVNRAYLIPYLTFIKENKNIYKAIHHHPELFNNAQTYDDMFKAVIGPVLNRFGLSEEDGRYIMAFYIAGISSLVMTWVFNDCDEDIEKIYALILLCVRPHIE